MITTKITVHVSAATLEDAKHQQGANFKLGICALLADGCIVELKTPDETIIFNSSEAFSTWFDGGVNDSVSEERPITASVRKVKLAGAVDVIVRQGAEPRLTILGARRDDMAKILTRIEGDCLTIDNEPMSVVMIGRGGMQQYVACNTGINTQSGSIINRSGNIQIDGGNIGKGESLTGSHVEVTLPEISFLGISGAGDATCFGLHQSALSLDLSGAGNITASGSVARLEADVSGAGKIRAFELNAENARLRVSGAGGIQATVTRSVRALVSGVGKIKIAGKPPERDHDVSGIGKIKFV